MIGSLEALVFLDEFVHEKVDSFELIMHEEQLPSEFIIVHALLE